MTLVKKTYKSSQLKSNPETEGDVVWTKVKVGKQNYITANLYLQKADPGYHDKVTAITTRLLAYRNRQTRIFLVGDINIDE